MDASIMDGRTLRAGALALVTRFRNPIRLARLVTEKTDHVMVACSGADRLAKTFRLENRNPVTSDAKRSWKFLTARLVREGVDYLPKTSGNVDWHDHD